MAKHTDAGSKTARWQSRIRGLSRREARQAEGRCIVEGIHAVCEAVDSGCPIEGILVCPERLLTDDVRDWVAGAAARGLPLVELSAGQFTRVARMDNPAALVAVAGWSPLTLDALAPLRPDLLVIAEGLDQPGNLGTLIRTSDGAGAGAVIASGEGADPTHRRCLRASLGTAFRLPVAVAPTTLEAIAWARATGYRIVATSPGAADTYAAARYRAPLAVVMGNERMGLSQETLGACDQLVRVPMHGTADSLNVAVAAGIVLFEARRQIDAAP